MFNITLSKLKVSGGHAPLGPTVVRPLAPDPLLQISTIRLSLPPRTSYIHSLTSIKITVTNLAEPDAGVTGKTRESSTLT